MEGRGGRSKERKKRERERVYRDRCRRLSFFERRSREGGIVFYKCHQSCEVEHCFSCFLSKNRSSAFGCVHTHTHTHFETIALETLLCQHIGHRLTHIFRDQVHYYFHTHTHTRVHTPTHTSTQFVCVSPTMIHCGKRLFISPCAGR